jgi:hypothetical protein
MQLSKKIERACCDLGGLIVKMSIENVGRDMAVRLVYGVIILTAPSKEL